MNDVPTAAEYLLGLLDPDERAAAAHRMEDDPDFCRAVLWWSERLAPWAGPVEDIAPPSSVWAAVSARIGAGPVTVRRQSEGVWIALGPGLRIKMLAVDPVTGERTALVRMQAGSVFPPHEHDEAEECFVIEGGIESDGQAYGAGDHMLGLPGTSHGAISSPAGSLLLLHWNSSTVKPGG